MKISQFQLERYFAKYEFSAPYLLSASDAESLSLKELLALADKNTLALWENLRLGYTESRGHPDLLKEISSFYERISPEAILEIVPEEGIFIVMQALLSPGDHAIATFPGYQSLYAVAEGMGCEVSKWEPEADPELVFNVGKLESLIRDETRLIVINFPHNPTGALPSKDQIDEVISLARERGITVFSDEMYRMLEYDPAERLPAVCDLYENSISLSGLSKSFALPGLRVGWLASQNKGFMDRFCTFKDYTTICGSAPSEILALAALRARDQILERNLDIIRTNLALLDQFFTQYGTWFRWTRPRAGTLAFPHYLGKNSVKEFCEDLLKKKGVLLVPADVFEYPHAHFRLGFGRRNMPTALGLLAEYLEENQQVI